MVRFIGKQKSNEVFGKSSADRGPYEARKHKGAPMAKKKILLITTGGTIASKPGEDGLTPQMGSGQLLSYMEDLPSHYDIDVEDLMSLDSSNIQAEEWQVMARAIAARIADYDGIVMTHGTDTMAYTASMLCYMLRNLDKPVVITGSQVPIDNMLTDARNNLYTAFAAAESGIQGVSIAFNRKIIRGCRAVKVRTMGFEAFESVNAGLLGEVYGDGLRKYVADKKPAGPFELKDSLSTDVFLLKLIPSTKPEIFDTLRSMNYRGIVIEAFGMGGMHFIRRNLLDALQRLTAEGVSVVVCSQCLYDASDLRLYEVGTKLLSCGVISGRDMTTEAAVTKLMWALGNSKDPEEVRRLFDTDLAGEVVIPE